jgi:hypothetical protein
LFLDLWGRAENSALTGIYIRFEMKTALKVGKFCGKLHPLEELPGALVWTATF